MPTTPIPPIKLRKLEISSRQIIKELNKKVIGQDSAKRLVATALFRHVVNASAYLRSNDQGEIFEAMRPLPLIMGESGNGKTFMIREAVRILREILGEKDYFPLLEIDCTQLSPTGYVGQSFSSLIYNHASRYHTGDKAKLATTIVYLDEFDKISTPFMTSQGEDWHKEIQYSLLKLLEGGEHSIQGERASDGHSIKVNTTSWLFILSGNFGQYRKERDKLEGKDKQEIGFIALTDSAKQKENKLHPKSILQKIGLATQLTGRITDIAEVTRLSDEELKTICLKNLLPEVLDFFKYIDYNISEDDINIDAVIQRCKDLKLGARGLKGELEHEVQEHVFNSVFKMEVIDTRNKV